jgi:hypothetical protein
MIEPPILSNKEYESFQRILVNLPKTNYVSGIRIEFSHDSGIGRSAVVKVVWEKEALMETLVVDITDYDNW